MTNNREDLKNYKYTKIWIKDRIEYIENQKETINKLSSILSDMPKRKQTCLRWRSGKAIRTNGYV